jgi:hypothetical protein
MLSWKVPNSESICVQFCHYKPAGSDTGRHSLAQNHGVSCMQSHVRHLVDKMAPKHISLCVSTVSLASQHSIITPDSANTAF